jgi:type IV pilus assembly protein PilO
MKFGLRELVFLIVLLSVPVASFVFVFKPRNAEIKQASSEIEHKTEKLEQLREVSRRIENIGVAIEEWRAAVEEIEQKLPSEQGIEEILEQVWNLTKKNELIILATHAEPAVPAASYMELPLKIEMTGNFDGFYQFLLELEQLQRITRVHQLKIWRAGLAKRTGRNRNNPNEEAPPPGAIETEFILSIYYESDHDDAAAGAAVASR